MDQYINDWIAASALPVFRSHAVLILPLRPDAIWEATPPAVPRLTPVNQNRTMILRLCLKSRTKLLPFIDNGSVGAGSRAAWRVSAGEPKEKTLP
jgi:hypothetical protein